MHSYIPIFLNNYYKFVNREFKSIKLFYFKNWLNQMKWNDSEN